MCYRGIIKHRKTFIDHKPMDKHKYRMKFRCDLIFVKFILCFQMNIQIALRFIVEISEQQEPVYISQEFILMITTSTENKSDMSSFLSSRMSLLPKNHTSMKKSVRISVLSVKVDNKIRTTGNPGTTPPNLEIHEKKKIYYLI